ncbi:MAG: DUF1640 domain-containing protein [Gammaproteobacteria bacterium]|nr:DUF1640 domain-containing protein [Gammaproteobacteria bacterium]
MSIVGNHTAGFNTLASSKRLKASGLPENQADTIVEVVDEALDSAIGKLATKADLADLKAEIFRMMWIQGGTIILIMSAFKFID